ncbi:MAG: hypothetical protein A3J93_03870 [Candidatus Magasanikbacteria bacterium RIFOXYC2_FULL_42_28]|uniref:Uncharacterized protein n=1 Tax=Candidatus Magasanikbacteria bacterium RIFOXYC2_FULL_42_28 TaxID=1798704 RepID=A0A1F6NUY5_9BACT|nr:MAG: hypothetical protein A3J93_03870 [Candidatus Magasanikbacteria bacterium RIFOXYC2_FULL_42_28]
MANWLRFWKKDKPKPHFFIFIVLGSLLLFSIFVIFFFSVKPENGGIFLTGLDGVNKIFGNEEWYCDAFGYEAGGLIKLAEPGRKWILIGNEFPEENKMINLKVQLAQRARKYFEQPNSVKIFYELTNASSEQVTSSILGAYFSTSSLKNSDELLFEEKINLSGLAVGKYKIKVKVEFDCGEATTLPQDIFVSHPLYVVWSFDWEGYNVKDKYLQSIDELASKHDNFPLTHLINPRLFITKTIPQANRDRVRDWLVEKKNKRGDSLGLHLHLFYENFEAAGLDIPEKDSAELEKIFFTTNGSMVTSTASTTVAFDKSKLKKKQIYDLTYWGYGRDDGYDIPITNLSDAEFDKILKWSKATFGVLGFGTPVTYRSGGWFANLATLQVLEENGFVVDSSGRTKYNFGDSKLPGFWDLATTSQPYQPNIHNQNSALKPTMKIWEFPNNGADSWWYSAKEMIERFNLNWGAVGGPLEKSTVVVFLSHPDWFEVDIPKVDELFNYTDTYLNSKDGGPVIYQNLENLHKIWEAN